MAPEVEIHGGQSGDIYNWVHEKGGENISYRSSMHTDIYLVDGEPLVIEYSKFGLQTLYTLTCSDKIAEELANAGIIRLSREEPTANS